MRKITKEHLDKKRLMATSWMQKNNESHLRSRDLLHFAHSDHVTFRVYENNTNGDFEIYAGDNMVEAVLKLQAT